MKKLILFSAQLIFCLSTLQVKSQCASPNAVSTSNLIVHLPFKNGTGTDISGNNFDGSIAMGSAAPGRSSISGTAESFSSFGAGVTIPHNALMDATNQITIAAWINSSAINNGQRIIDKINGTTTGNFLLDLNAAKPRFYVGPGFANSTTPLLSNTWYFIAGTYDGSTAKLYVNGTVVASSNFSGNLTVNTSPIKIGCAQNDGINFSGKIDDVKYYKRALSQSEILDLYQSPEFSIQPQNTIMCSNLTSLSCNAISTGTAVTYKWKKAGAYLTDNSTYTGTGTNVLYIHNGTASELGKYEAEAYSQNCIVAVSDTAVITSGSASTFNNAGLILNYPFNYLSNKDISGNNLTASFNNVISPISDQNGIANMAVYLNGATSISTPHNNIMNVTNQITLAAWFNSSSIFAPQRIIDKLTSTTTGNFVMDLNSSQLRFFCGSASITNTTSLSPNTWYHAACTYDGANLKMYINGNLTNTVAYTGTITPNTSQFFIGQDQIGSGQFLGSINDVRFYSRALSQAEITQLLNLSENTIAAPSQTICPGEPVNIVTYASPVSGTFQWLKNGVPLSDGGNISGAYTRTLTINNVGVSDFDTYSCELTNANCLMIGSGTTAVVQRSVTTVLNDNLVLYYPFHNGATSDLSGNQLNMTTVLAVSATPDRESNNNEALFFTGTGSQCNTVSNSLMYSNGNQVTFSLWIKPANTGDQRIIEKTNSYYLDIYNNSLRFILNSGSVLNTGYVPSVNTWQHIAATYDGSTMRFYVNGVLFSSIAAAGITIAQNTNQLLFGVASGSNPYRYTGAMDEIRFYKRALSAQEISAIYYAASQTSQLSPLSACPNASATLGANVLSSVAVDYQWFFNGALLSGETTPTLSLNGINGSTTGNYVYSFSSHCTTMFSDTAAVSLLPVPTATAVASATLVCNGQTLNLSSSATASSYTWTSQNSGNISSTQTVALSPTASDVYSLTVSNGTCTAQSAVSVSVSACTGIEEQLGANSIFIYPNPANEVINVKLSAYESSSLSIHDITGQLVKAQVLSKEENEVSLSDLNKGIYFIMIASSHGTTTHKIIKQ